MPRTLNDQILDLQDKLGRARDFIQVAGDAAGYSGAKSLPTVIAEAENLVDSVIAELATMNAGAVDSAGN